MPSTSQKQHNLMAMVANNPVKSKELGIPQSVGKDFTAADKGLKFGKGTKTRADLQKINKPETRHGKAQLFKEGGMTMASKMNPGFMAMMAKKKDSGKKMAEGGKADMKQDKAVIKKAVGMHDKQQHGGKKTDLAMLKSGGRTAAKGDHAVQKKAKVGAKMVKMTAMKRGGKC